MNCGTLGRPSPDNKSRLYTEEECNQLGGNYGGNGECLAKTGGSYSYECASLNSTTTPSTNLIPLPPDNSGTVAGVVIVILILLFFFVVYISYRKQGGGGKRRSSSNNSLLMLLLGVIVIVLLSQGKMF